MNGFETSLVEAGTPLLMAGGAVAAYGTFAPRSQLWGRLIFRGAGNDRRVALTFDDGPLPGATDRILDVLGEANVEATFFVIGRNARENPGLVRRMHEQGHLVGNHSYDHASCGFLRGPWFWKRQIEKTDLEVAHIIGVGPRLFRPPLGIKTWVMTAAASPRHATVTWSRRAFDGVTTTAEQILRRLVPHTKPGEVLALHDGVGPQSRRDPSATVDAIGPLLTGLRARGLEPVRLDALTGVEPYGPVEAR